ncbi:MAG: hypothetical protein K0Q90_558 [Paenibacillaceae bacterium]|jgi:hypothetical protein|nr:hypothetical protein [Paenibacillaceae bacterium]
MKWGKRVLAVWLAAALALAGCSAADKSESSTSSVSSESGSSAGLNNSAADQMKVTNTALQSDKDAAGSGPAAQPAAQANNSSQGAGFSGMGTDLEGLNRKLVYKAILTMKVKSYAEAQAEIRNLVTLSGGYILQFSENSTSREEGGNFVLKIPSAGFSTFLKELEKIPNEAIQRNVQAQDFSEEYVDLEAQLKAKLVVEARYLEFMQKATRTEELVQYTNELAKIQEAIEKMKGRMRYIDQNVAFSTVEIRLYQPGSYMDTNKKADSVFGRSRDAMLSSLGFLAGFGQGLLVFIAGVIPIAVIGSVIGIPMWIGLRANRKKRAERAEAYTQKMQAYKRNPPPVEEPFPTVEPKDDEGSQDKTT